MISDNLIVYQYTLTFYKHPFYNPGVYMICFVDSGVQLGIRFCRIGFRLLAYADPWHYICRAPHQILLLNLDILITSTKPKLFRVLRLLTYQLCLVHSLRPCARRYHAFCCFTEVPSLSSKSSYIARRSDLSFDLRARRTRSFQSSRTLS